MHENIDPGVFQAFAPSFEKFQVLGNLRALTAPLASLVRAPHYSSLVIQPNVESISLTLETSVDLEAFRLVRLEWPVNETLVTPHCRSWENVMISISTLPSIKRFIIAYMRPPPIPGKSFRVP